MKIKNACIGQMFPTKSGSVIIKEIISRSNITIEFIQTGYIKTNVTLDNLARGSVKDLTAKSVYGVGYLGEGYTKGDLKNKSYTLWANMIKRCYAEGFDWYEGVTVCERWHNYSNFKEDIKLLAGYGEWINENGKYELDKDVLSGKHKTYSPFTCCFLPSTMNRQLTKVTKAQNNLSLF